MESIHKIADKLLLDFGDVDILVNNAGIYRYTPFTKMTETLWDKTMNLNIKAVTFLSKEIVNVMLDKNHGGRIINISSTDSLKPTGNLSHYDTSKGGVRMLTRAMAKELGAYGITVNDIAPGGIQTPGIQQIAGDDIPESQKEEMKKQTDAFAKSLPLQRMGTPEDIGNAALFLASEASGYMTGSTLVVDGGLLIL